MAFSKNIHKKIMGKRSGKFRPFFLSGLFLVLLLCGLTGLIFAKYVYQADAYGYVRANNFYFTSDLLDGETHVLAAGTSTITFTLGNHEDKLRYSEMDITYCVNVTGKSGTNDVGISPSSGTLGKNAINDVNITLSDLKNGETYTVTATGTGGYEKTLTATFKVQEETAQVYKYLTADTEGNQYVLLTVWSQGYTGDVTITFPNTLAPDNTDSVMRKVKSTDGSFKDSISFQNESGNNTSHVYRFFGSNVKAEDFTVNYGDNKTATTKAPQ